MTGADQPPELSRRILDALINELCPHCRVWGEAPGLLFAYCEGGQVGVRDIQLPAVLWMLGPTAEILAQLADAAEHILPMWGEVVPPGLLGVALRCEAHYVHDMPTAEVQALSKGDVRNHPAAQRGRFACAVDRGGYTYGVETDELGEVTGARIVQPFNRDAAAVGSIPDALDRLLTAVLGVPMPARPDVFPWPDTREEPDK